jgi:hypothetical protein
VIDLTPRRKEREWEQTWMRIARIPINGIGTGDYELPWEGGASSPNEPLMSPVTLRCNEQFVITNTLQGSPGGLTPPCPVTVALGGPSANPDTLRCDEEV